MLFKNSTLKLFCFLSIMIFVVTACGKKEESKSTTSQVVAKVNGDEISIHQVNFQLSRLGQMTEAQSKAAAKEVVANLVNQQIFKQKAIESKLDRDPRILQALEATKDQMLAQAYVEQEMSKAAKPSRTDIDKFYTEHPELFESRRLFNLQEIAVEVGSDKLAEIQQGVASHKSLKDVAEWLQSKGYKFSYNANPRAAEQLAMPLLKRLQALKDGDTIVIQNDRSVNIIHIAGIQAQPIPKDKAVPVIEQYFLNQNKTALLKKNMEDLKKVAKIEYMGEFKDLSKNEIAKPETAAIATGVPSATSDISTQSVPAEVSSNQTTSKSTVKQSNIEKGLSGL